ncbi:MAG TPA: zinc ribbon domain-containing protein [Anaerolineae bacterium]|nr:zinc ribbon domain-containing protein [Anaerolineae bacterium]
MATLVVVVLALLVVAFVGYPLFAGKGTVPEGQRGRRRDSSLQQVVVQQGVVYADREEAELDRALGRLAEADAVVAVEAKAEVDEEIEKRVRALRRKRKRARPAKKAVCPRCGRQYEPGDRFCARCGRELVSK